VQDSLGKAIVRFPRESLFVITKLGTLEEGESVWQSLQGSLKRLILEYVDLWLIHMPHHHEDRLKVV
jgi:diketogulonate reductase-like aldo/keto reductase